MHLARISGHANENEAKLSKHIVWIRITCLIKYYVLAVKVTQYGFIF